jgi:hypothetical protein
MRNQSRGLWAAAGWSLTLLVWMIVELGQQELAENHDRTAWACAKNAGGYVSRVILRHFGKMTLKWLPTLQLTA